MLSSYGRSTARAIAALGLGGLSAGCTRTQETSPGKAPDAPADVHAPHAVSASAASSGGVAPIGEATMLADGTIVLDLVAVAGETRGHSRMTYPPGHPEYASVSEHLGGLRPGERKPVLPWPDTIDDDRAQAASRAYVVEQKGWDPAEVRVSVVGTDQQGRIVVSATRKAGGTGESLSLRLDSRTYAVVEVVVVK